MTDSPTTDTTVEQSVLEILAGALDVSVDVLRGEPVLARHEWDSISSLDALAQLENRLDVSLDLRAFHAARTVEDVVALVRPTS